ncbi:MAG: hypothetical protein M1829_006304 [Trizodia sp. TS-e1964]|nr:MAG: hypothetical protein M1829_006304 [Trizodia sp. TS-e1964]
MLLPTLLILATGIFSTLSTASPAPMPNEPGSDPILLKNIARKQPYPPAVASTQEEIFKDLQRGNELALRYKTEGKDLFALWAIAAPDATSWGYIVYPVSSTPEGRADPTQDVFLFKPFDNEEFNTNAPILVHIGEVIKRYNSHLMQPIALSENQRTVRLLFSKLNSNDDHWWAEVQNNLEEIRQFYEFPYVRTAETQP